MSLAVPNPIIVTLFRLHHLSRQASHPEHTLILTVIMAVSRSKFPLDFFSLHFPGYEAFLIPSLT
jgi:hypothetical protein